MCSPYFVYYGLVHSLKQIITKYSVALTFEKSAKHKTCVILNNAGFVYIS